MKNLKLFCVPYAGGSAMAYARWRKYLSSSIDLCPIEMAGRGSRDAVPFNTNFNETVDDLYEMIKDKIEYPYAIFGHSMGCWLAYELYQKIISMGHKEPVHIFLSGNAAPHVKKYEKLSQDLSDAEFKEEILKLGGTRKEVFANKQLFNVYLPILRADYRVLESYQYKGKRQINCNVTVFSGTNDEFSQEDIKTWEDYTHYFFSVYTFEGGHFFINEKTQEVVKVINNILVDKNYQGYGYFTRKRVVTNGAV